MPPHPQGTKGKLHRLCDKDRSRPQLSQGQITKPYLLMYTRSRLHSVTPHVEQPECSSAEECAQKGPDIHTVETALGERGRCPQEKPAKGTYVQEQVPSYKSQQGLEVPPR